MVLGSLVPVEVSSVTGGDPRLCEVGSIVGVGGFWSVVDVARAGSLVSIILLRS